MTEPDELDRAERDAEAEAEAAADAAVGREALVENDEADDTGPLTSNEYSVAFSPRNVAVGLAIVAGLVAYAASRRRRRSRDRDG